VSAATTATTTAAANGSAMAVRPWVGHAERDVERRIELGDQAIAEHALLDRVGRAGRLGQR